MKARLVSRARLREPSLQERFTYYQKLLRARMPIELIHAKKGSADSYCVPRYRTIALDEGGHELRSVDIANRISELQRQAVPGLVFIIGEADGLRPEERDAADEVWSLSRLTLPHQLCMVVLVEQLYRATAILRGEPYHRE